MNADEAFMTATPFCILPVTALNGTPIGNGRTGAITQKLLDTWGANVGVDIVGQIRQWHTRPAAAGQGASPYSFRTRK